MNFEKRFKQLLDVPVENAANALPHYDVTSRRGAINVNERDAEGAGEVAMP